MPCFQTLVPFIAVAFLLTAATSPSGAAEQAAGEKADDDGWCATSSNVDAVGSTAGGTAGRGASSAADGGPSGSVLLQSTTNTMFLPQQVPALPQLMVPQIPALPQAAALTQIPALPQVLPTASETFASPSLASLLGAGSVLAPGVDQVPFAATHPNGAPPAGMGPMASAAAPSSVIPVGMGPIEPVGAALEQTANGMDKILNQDQTRALVAEGAAAVQARSEVLAAQAEAHGEALATQATRASEEARRAVAKAAEVQARGQAALATAAEAQKAAEAQDRQARHDIEKALLAQKAAEQLYEQLKEEEVEVRKTAADEVRQAREEALAQVSRSVEAENAFKAKAEASVRRAQEELAAERQRTSMEVQTVLAKLEQAQSLVESQALFDRTQAAQHPVGAAPLLQDVLVDQKGTAQ